METFLRGILPRIVPTGCTFQLHNFPYKRDLQRLRVRLRAYARWLPPDWRLVLLVDRDQDDCRTLKQQLDDSATDVNLRPRSLAGSSNWRLVSRIAIEELEAWYFGSWDAVRRAYPRVPATVPQRAKYRVPDGILAAPGRLSSGSSSARDTSLRVCERLRRRGRLRRTSIHGKAAQTASPDFAMPSSRQQGSGPRISQRSDGHSVSVAVGVLRGVDENRGQRYITRHELRGRSSVG